MAFIKATKGKKPVRVVLGGPSGSGKTYTALTFAKYLESVTGKPTAAIDTEHYRMSLYADKFDFEVDNKEPPFDPNTLIKAIHDAEKEGYGQMIVDSSTHYYSGEGGLLEIVNNAAKQKFGGNVYAGWAVGTPIQNELVDTMIRSPLHMIFCTRAKQAYEKVEKGGRTSYEKVGMELQQRDGFEFDFDFFLMMDMDNNASVDKGMGYVTTGMYIKKPDEKTIELIMRSINENTTEEIAVPPTKFVEPKPEDALKSLQASTFAKCQELSTTNSVGLKEVLSKYSSKNPNKIKDIEELKKLDVDLDDLKNIMEQEKENK